MQYQVFIQNDSHQHFVASVFGVPNLIVEGKTEDEVIARVKAALESQLARGKLVTIEVNPHEQLHSIAPQMKYAGIFANDSTFDDWMEKMAAIRQEANAIDDEE